MRLTVEEIAGAVHGSLSGSAAPGSPESAPSEAAQPYGRLAGEPGAAFSESAVEVTGVTWDSRAVRAGDLYVALPGERADGHDFAGSAVQAGAAAVLAMRDIRAGVPVVRVEDTAAALADLAAFWRRRLSGRIVGLTGSSGKTTTKNLLRDVLAAAGTVVATKANQNNELGVPATLLAAGEDAAAVVVEMGMRGLGQIAELCEIARPDWGLITNVGESHMELLGSRDNIARAKSELLAALPAGGIAFVNADDDYAREVCEFARLGERGVRIVLFDGSGSGSIAPGEPDAAFSDAPRVWASDVALDGEGRPSFTVNAAGFAALGLPGADGSCSCALKLRGLHNVSNACSAAAVGLAAGLSLGRCCEALAASQPEQGRQQVLRAPNGALVVDDAYNANPDSMAAALATFAAMDVPGRRIAVLGDMGELGDLAPEAHRRVGRMAAASGLDCLVCVGELAALIAEAARGAGMPEAAIVRHDDVDAALQNVKSQLGPADAVLVKASHFMRFDRIVEGLVG